MANLADIRTKIRRLTRSPSTQQISDATINDYVNNFVLYDMPEHLRQFSERTTLTFYTEPNVDYYDTNTTNVDDPLYDFKNKYITTETPAYVAGYQVMFSQSQEQFYAIFPFNNTITDTGQVGDGATTNFTGTLSAIPVMQNHVLFTSYDTAGDGLKLVDLPSKDAGTGIPSKVGDIIVPNNTTSVGTIDYIYGTYDITFPNPPALNAKIMAQTVVYQAARPAAMLYYDNTFYFRPVPDQVYEVRMDVYKQPTELLTDASNPEINQWWEYIAYGAAIKIFQDRMDMESVTMVMPEFKNQEKLVLRRTLVQQAKERTLSIYCNQVSGQYGPWGRGGGLF